MNRVAQRKTAMAILNRYITDVELLLAMGPEDTGGAILPLIAEVQKERGGQFHPQDLQALYEGATTFPPDVRLYPFHRKPAVERIIVEGIAWLQNVMLLVPTDFTSTGGANGWMRLTRRGEQVIKENSFADYRRTMDFPKSLLHPAIADKVWLELARGDIEDAVFAAYKALEIAVRTAAGYSAKEIGVPMMRNAFDPNRGPLTDMNATMAEREALAALFAGAVGSYKNPVSHRTVTVSEVREAQEMVVLASHLLRIVDVRQPKAKL